MPSRKERPRRSVVRSPIVGAPFMAPAKSGAVNRAPTAAISSLLFEIGVEELPADFIELGQNLLRQGAEKILAEDGRMSFQSVQAFGTPRRLVLSVSGLSPLPPVSDKILGPLIAAAYDGEGKPTAALKGFAESRGAAVSDVFTEDSPKGKRIAIQVARKPLEISACLEKLAAQLSFPKMMRWIGVGGEGLTFARPVRWIVAFKDNKPIRLKIGSVKSDRFTYGHRFLSPKKIRIASADLSKYKALLKRAHVWLDEKERVSFIQKSLDRLKTHNADTMLMRTVARLVEEPFPCEGEFSKDYLDLPSEVLSTCMARNQKIFACYTSAGKATNRFIAFLNGRRPKIQPIAKEYRRVLEARLSDAALFFRDDQKISLTKRAEQLKQLVFLGKLGTLFDKQERVARLGAVLVASSGKFSGLKDKIVKAAKICKADLMSHMVYEFPDLQGSMGTVYAEKEGVESEVASAIRDHYWPKSLKDKLNPKKPTGILGAWLGIADRLDTLVGAIGSGIELTGSQDPYALRRAAGGIVKIVNELRLQNIARLEFSLSHAVPTAHAGYPNLKIGAEDVLKKLTEIFKERIVTELWNGKDSRERELLQSVLATSADNILEAIEKFEDLRNLFSKERKTFAQACKVVERTSNILKGFKQPLEDRVEPGLIEKGVEESLFQTMQGAEKQIEKCVDERRFDDATRVYADEFYEIIHKYFDEVLVNVEDEAVRRNRHSMMKRINRLYTARIADLTCLTQIGEL